MIRFLFTTFNGHFTMGAAVVEVELASTRDKDLAGQIKYGGNCDAAKLVGQSIAEKAKSAGIDQACFDRGSYKFHGRVAELANAAREGGLQF